MMKHEAAQCLTFAPSNKETETKALRQVVQISTWLTLLFTKYTGTCVDVALWYGIKNGRIHGQLGWQRIVSEPLITLSGAPYSNMTDCRNTAILKNAVEHYEKCRRKLDVFLKFSVTLMAFTKSFGCYRRWRWRCNADIFVGARQSLKEHLDGGCWTWSEPGL